MKNYKLFYVLSIVAFVMCIYKFFAIISTFSSDLVLFYSEVNSGFLALCLSSFLLFIGNKFEGKLNQTVFVKIYSIVLLIVTVALASVFVNKLIKSEFLNSTYLYNQISSIFLLIVSFLLLVVVQVKSRNKGELPLI